MAEDPRITQLIEGEGISLPKRETQTHPGNLQKTKGALADSSSRLDSLIAGAGGDSEFDLEEMLSEMGRDLVEGAVAPVKAGVSTTSAILAHPAIGILPASDQEEHWKEAGDQAIKGAAFWGSTLVGGRIAGMAAKPLLKAVLGGGSAAASFELVNELPEYITQEKSNTEYLRDISTAATFGALTGGVISKVPAGVRIGSREVMKLANKTIDLTPGGAKIRNEVGKRLNRVYNETWYKFFTSGQEVLKRAGLGDVAKQLEIARGTAASLGGRLSAGFFRNTKDLSDEERKIVGSLLDDLDFRTVGSGDVVNAAKDKFAPGMDDVDFSRLMGVARSEYNRLRKVGEMLQKAGLKTYDAINDEFHTFSLRNAYLPHRFNNPSLYREGGALRQKSIEVVADKLQILDDEAAVWLDNFADRIEGDISGYIEGRFTLSGANHYLQGRNMGLPGFETDIMKVLPQYYEAVARRLTNHTIFGDVQPVESAVRRAVQEGLFSEEEMAAMVGKSDKPEQMIIEEFANITGKGMKKTKLPPDTKESLQAVISKRRKEAFEETARAMSVERRYPKAFVRLEGIADPEMKKLAKNIIRRQLGAIDNPQFGEYTLSKLSKLEVVTKLALGAISQPSQMLTAVARTGFKGATSNFFKAMSNNPEALDFAMRTGVILRGIVRQSEESFAGRGADFLERVFFTQMDLKSRVFGALQGRAYAEHMARKLASMNRRFPIGKRPANVQTEMAKIEKKLREVGLDTRKVIRNGGYLDTSDIIKAGQTVSSDVNFWGDSLSLPEFFRSPYGKYITQFKSFGFQQSRLIKEHILKPLEEGDWGPFTRFATLMPAGGEVISDLKSLARARTKRFNEEGDPEPDAVVMRFAENMANAGGFSIIYDALEATRYGMGGSLGFIAGPIGSTAGRAWTAGGDLLRGETEKATRLGIETVIPGITAIVAPKALPLVAASAPAISNLLSERE